MGICAGRRLAQHLLKNSSHISSGDVVWSICCLKGNPKESWSTWYSMLKASFFLRIWFVEVRFMSTADTWISKRIDSLSHRMMNHYELQKALLQLCMQKHFCLALSPQESPSLPAFPLPVANWIVLLLWSYSQYWEAFLRTEDPDRSCINDLKVFENRDWCNSHHNSDMTAWRASDFNPFSSPRYNKVARLEACLNLIALFYVQNNTWSAALPADCLPFDIYARTNVASKPLLLQLLSVLVFSVPVPASWTLAAVIRPMSALVNCTQFWCPCEVKVPIKRLREAFNSQPIAKQPKRCTAKLVWVRTALEVKWFATLKSTSKRDGQCSQ